MTATLPRISREGPIKYKSCKFSVGTPVSMTIVDVHNDEDVYADPSEFRAERWIGRTRAKNGEQLDRYLVAFSKGPRQCLGIK